MSSNISKTRIRIRNLVFHWKSADWTGIKERSTEAGYRSLPYVAMINATWMHGASFENFFDLGFFRMPTAERRKWLTRSLRYEITRQLNNPVRAAELKDKLTFARKFPEFIGRHVYSWADISAMDRASVLGPVVVKPQFGHEGQGVQIVEDISTVQSLRDWVAQHLPTPHDFLFEEKIRQHPSLITLAPRSVNTLRIVTVRTGGTVDLLGVPCLKMGVNSFVDNISAGGIVAAVDADGVVRRPAVSKSIFNQSFDRHPVSQAKILGFSVPLFHEAVALTKKIAAQLDDVRCVGWDVAIAGDRACIIEGNPAWSERILQVALGAGLRAEADRFANTRLVYS